jgi:hypothetical protein
MSLGINCPHADDNLKLHPPSAAPTICVVGTYTGSDLRPLNLFGRLVSLLQALFAWLLRCITRKPTPPLPTKTPLTLRVRVIAGSGSTSPASKSGDATITPPPASWCASPVVPTGSGSEFTAVAWVLNSSGSIVDGPQRVPFSTGGASPKDCCSSCPGFGLATTLVEQELASHPPLAVAVPDGPNSGLHKATAVAHLTWETRMGGEIFKVLYDTAATLVVQGRTFSAASTAVESHPFSAIFPGGVFGAAGDVVVTTA